MCLACRNSRDGFPGRLSDLRAQSPGCLQLCGEGPSGIAASPDLCDVDIAQLCAKTRPDHTLVCALWETRWESALWSGSLCAPRATSCSAPSGIRTTPVAQHSVLCWPRHVAAAASLVPAGLTRGHPVGRPGFRQPVPADPRRHAHRQARHAGGSTGETVAAAGAAAVCRSTAGSCCLPLNDQQIVLSFQDFIEARVAYTVLLISLEGKQ